MLAISVLKNLEGTVYYLIGKGTELHKSIHIIIFILFMFMVIIW